MGSIPLVANTVNPPQQQDLMGNLSKIMQLRNMQQNIQGGQLENQQRAQQIKDSQAMTNAMLNWDPSSGYDVLAHSVLQNGGSAAAATAMHTHGLEVRQKTLEIAKLDEENGTKHLENLGKRNDLLLGHLSTVVDGPDDGIGQRLTAATQQAVQDGLLDQPHAQQILQFANLPAAQLRPALSTFEKSLQGESIQFQRAMDERKQNAEEWKEAGPGTLINTRTGETKQGTLPVEQQSFNNYMQTVQGATPANYPAWKAKQEAIATEPIKIHLATAEASARQAIADGDPMAAGKLLHDGVVSPSQIISARKPEFAQKAFSAAAGFGDGWNAQKAEADFKVASSPQNVSFFGSAKSLTDKGGTLDQLAAAAKDIPANQIPVFNTVADAIKASTGSGPIAKYASLALGVADDYSKVMGGGQGSDTSRTQALNLIAAKQSPEQRQAAIDGIRGAVSSQTNSRIGNNAVLQKMYGGQGSTGQPAMQPSQPQSTAPPAQAGYTRIQASDGSIHDIPSGNINKARQRDPGLQVIN